MHDPNDEDTVFLISLSEHPAIAEKIGQFVVCYSGLELLLWKLYGLILGKDEMAAIELLGGIQSFTHKTAAIERYIKYIEHPRQNEILKLLEDARKINSFRIDLMHGVYAEHRDKSIWLHSSRTDPTREKRRLTHLTPTVVHNKATAAHQLANKIGVDFFDANPKGDTELPVTLLSI